jgi:hypothetical protein
MNSKMFLVFIFIYMLLIGNISGEYSDSRPNEPETETVNFQKYEIQAFGHCGILKLYLESLVNLPEKRQIERGEFELPKGYKNWSQKEIALFRQKINKVMKTIDGKRWVVIGIPFKIGRYDIDKGCFGIENSINIGKISIYDFPKSEGIREVLNRTFMKTQIETLNKSLGQYCREITAPQVLNIKIRSSKMCIDVAKASHIRKLCDSNQITFELSFQLTHNRNKNYLTLLKTYLVDSHTKKTIYEWKHNKIFIANKHLIDTFPGVTIEIRLLE